MLNKLPGKKLLPGGNGREIISLSCFYVRYLLERMPNANCYISRWRLDFSILLHYTHIFGFSIHRRGTSTCGGGGGGSWWCATCAGKLCAPKSLISLWFLFLILVVWKPINPTFWKKFYTSIDLPFGQNGQKASNNNYMTNESGVANRVQVSISSFFWQLFLP